MNRVDSWVETCQARLIAGLKQQTQVDGWVETCKAGLAAHLQFTAWSCLTLAGLDRMLWCVQAAVNAQQAGDRR